MFGVAMLHIVLHQIYTDIQHRLLNKKMVNGHTDIWGFIFYIRP